MIDADLLHTAVKAILGTVWATALMIMALVSLVTHWWITAAVLLLASGWEAHQTDKSRRVLRRAADSVKG